MECATLAPLETLLAAEAQLQLLSCQRAVVLGNGTIEFRKSRNTTTFFCNSAEKIADLFRLHERGLGDHLYLFGSSKGVPPTATNGHVDIYVTVMALPPLIIELSKRGHKSVVRTTFNKATVDDEGGFRLPPHFQYPPTAGPHFRSQMLQHVLGLQAQGAPVSDRFVEQATA